MRAHKRVVKMYCHNLLKILQSDVKKADHYPEKQKGLLLLLLSADENMHHFELLYCTMFIIYFKEKFLHGFLFGKFLTTVHLVPMNMSCHL